MSFKKFRIGACAAPCIETLRVSVLWDVFPTALAVSGEHEQTQRVFSTAPQQIGHRSCGALKERI